MTALRTCPDGRVPVLLSAHDEALIARDADALLRYLDRDASVRAVAATLLRTRRVRRYRAVLRVADGAELTDALRAVSDGVEHPLVARSATAAASRRAFVFPGQGSQWAGMGASAYHLLDDYRAEADRCAQAFTAHAGDAPLTYLITPDRDTSATQVEIQGAQFIHAVALARVWGSYGLRPDLTVGHSLGEVAAAYVAGSIELSDAVAAVIARAEAVQRFEGGYGMAVLGISPEDAEALIVGTPGWLELSAVNSRAAVVVSGDRDAVSAITAGVGADGRFARELTVDYPGHTSALESVAAQMAERLPRTRFLDPAVPFVGASTGTTVPSGTEFGEYWRHNLRSTVRFDRAVETAIDRGARTFIELSAHPALLMALADLTDGLPGPEPALLLGSGRRDDASLEELSAGIVAAAVADPDYRWSDFTDPTEPLLRGFPNAPMRAEHLWLAPQAPAPTVDLTVAVEKWERTTISATAQSTDLHRIAVLGLGADTQLVHTLTEALDRHPGTAPVAAEDAEILVLVAPPLDHPDAARATEEIGALVAEGLLRYTDAIGARCREVCLLTVGGEQIGAHEPVALPAQAALAALHRTIGFEHDDQTFRHIDLPSWDLDADAAAAVVAVVLTEVIEAALRTDRTGPVLYRRALVDAAPAAPWRLDTGLLDDVVITGGAGAIGTHYARYLAERGARRIVLLSRSGADLAVIAELGRRYGTLVVAPRCDITDPEQLRHTAAEFGADGATLLIHAAAVATLGTGEGFTAGEFVDTFGAKVIGLARMTELWPLRPDSRILLCSSVSGVWGGRGHPAYPAANRMLDVMAGQLRAKNQHCVSIRWGLWQVDGIADAAEMAQIARSGLRPMPPASAIEASLHDHIGDPMVLAADPERLRIFVDSQVSGTDGGHGTVENLDIPAAVRAELGSVLRVSDPAVLDLDASLFELGIDSLLALDLRKRLKRVTGRKVGLATLLGGITGAGLIAELEGAGGEGRTEATEKVESRRD